MDKAAGQCAMQKVRSEARLLQWLAVSSDIPVPTISFWGDDQHCDFIIMEKLPGEMLLNSYGKFDTAAKVLLKLFFKSFRLKLSCSGANR
jgi:aminoglycoside phosphotransferase